MTTSKAKKDRWIGIDVGGANIKVADSEGWSHTHVFPLWQQPEQLSRALRMMLSEQNDVDRFAITMTGELADCFVDRAEGVAFIVDALRDAIGDTARMAVYDLDGGWKTATEARQRPDDVAAANWHALASFASRYLKTSQRGLLVDIGSTTTDLIAIDNSGVITDSRSDLQRLTRSELLYCGIRRTPLCAIADTLPYRGSEIPVMAELFATTDDCFLVLGHTTEDDEDTDTVDSKPRTAEYSRNRLARMIGLDHRGFTLVDAVTVSERIQEIMRIRIAKASSTVAPDASMRIVSGHGDWLLSGAGIDTLYLADQLGQGLSRVGPAYAVARLAADANP